MLSLISRTGLASSPRFSFRRPLHRQFMTVMSSQTKAFILDFDGTITTKDTISTLLNFAISTQSSRGLNLHAALSEILARYNEDYSHHIQNYKPGKEERNTIAQEIDYYRSLKTVETRSFERVSRSGLFKGILSLEWEEFGRDAVKRGEVVVRKGFGDFIEKVVKSGGTWGVVSVNFSRDFIRGVLASTGVDTSMVRVLTNHPDENGVLVGPGIEDTEYGLVMATSDAKLASMKALLSSWKKGRGEQFLEVVYIGDSGTDIECLAEKRTTGIVIAEDRKNSLTEILNRVGVDVKHIGNYQAEQKSTVYWARDFREIAGNSFLVS